MGFTSEYMGSLEFKRKVLDLRNVETEEKFREGIYRLRINHFYSYGSPFFFFWKHVYAEKKSGGISCRAIEKSDFIQFLKDSFEKYKHNDIIQCQLLCCITELVNRSRLPVIPAVSICNSVK